MTRRRASFFGLELALHRHVYEPAEDSELMARNLPDALDADTRCLDMCTGTGAAALLMARAGSTRVVATELNPIACATARGNAEANGLAGRVEVAQMDLAAGLADASFSFIACNPPYLPTALEERVRGLYNRALDGGPTGADTTRAAIGEIARVLAPGGRALLVVSDLQPVTELEGHARALGLGWDVMDEASMGFETLWLVGLKFGQAGP